MNRIGLAQTFQLVPISTLVISVKNHHTFGLGATCRQLVATPNQQQLVDALSHHKDDPLLILGEGSNCIFVADFDGIVIKPQLKGIALREDDKSFQINVAAGENWHQFVHWCLNKGISGFENLALIPGTVGASPIQNIGAYGVEISKFIESVTVLYRDTLDVIQMPNSECQFGYRDSVFKNELLDKTVVLNVSFVLPKQWQPVVNYGELCELKQPTSQAIFDKVVEIRQSKLPDPAVVGNAGSFFKNPVIPVSLFDQLSASFSSIPHFIVDTEHVKVPAAWLIDQAGFKGVCRGGVQCHPKQALVLTNYNHATGPELLNFAREIKHTVHEKYAIELENEVRLMGSRGWVTL
jgi:UDP-N-acetylmuramate dehydrogenase